VERKAIRPLGHGNMAATEKSIETYHRDVSPIDLLGQEARMEDHPELGVSSPRVDYLRNCSMVIQDIAERLDLQLSSMVVKEAKLNAMKLFPYHRRGVGIYIVTAFSLISAARIHRVHRVGLKQVMRAYEEMGHRLSIKTYQRFAFQASEKIPIPRPPSARECVSLVVARLAPPPQTCGRIISVSSFLIRKASESDPSRTLKNPRCLAASAVFAGERLLSMDERRAPWFDIYQVAESIDMSVNAVRENYREVFEPMFGRLDIWFPIERAY
jgi:hypothetical protein